MNAFERDLLTSLDDSPRWCLARDALRAGNARILRSPGQDACLVGPEGPGIDVLVGRPTPELLKRHRELPGPSRPVFLPAEQTEGLRELLPRWRVRACSLHLHAAPGRLPRPTGRARRVAIPDSIAWPAGWSAQRNAVGVGTPAAAVVEAGETWAFCHAAARTESLWDVSVVTVPERRRRGHGSDAFLALAHGLLAEGLQPLWGCFDDNVASMSMARRLGFERAEAMAFFEPPLS